MSAIIVTNNPLVKEKFGEDYNIEFVEGSLLDVLKKTRDKVHEGHKLLTHPLSGSVKPNETPYKSVLITYKKEDLDLDSTMMISSNVETVEKFISIKQPIRWEDKILEDFMEIDMRLIESGIKSMRQL